MCCAVAVSTSSCARVLPVVNVCVESAVRDGAARDYYCKILSDATATLTMEDHNACMKNMVWFGGVASADDVLGALKQRQEDA